MFQESAELKSLSWVTSRSRKLAIVAADVGSRVGIDDSLVIGAEVGPVGVKVDFVDGISVGIHVGDDISPPFDVVFNSVGPYRNPAHITIAAARVKAAKLNDLKYDCLYGFGGANG